jgi:hypothetical protein
MNIENRSLARVLVAVFAMGFGALAAGCSGAPEGEAGTSASAVTAEDSHTAPAGRTEVERTETEALSCTPNPNVCENKGCGEFNDGCTVINCGPCGGGLCISLGAEGTECLCPSGEHMCPSPDGHGGSCTRSGCSFE